MATINPSFHAFLSFVFPQDVLQFFDLTEVRTLDEETIEVVLTEINATPEIPPEQRGKHISSKGFHKSIRLQHFPVQDKFCVLAVHRRRWEIEGEGTIERTLSFLPETGLKVTTTFAAFLKEADRTRAGGDRTHRETVRGEGAGTVLP